VPSAFETFASSALLRPCALLPASFTACVSQGGESLPREATRSSSLCEVALARAEEVEERRCCGEEEEEDEEDEEDDVNVAAAPRGAETARRATPSVERSNSIRCCLLVIVRGI